MTDINFHGPKWLVKSTTTIGTTATVASLVLLYLDVTDRLGEFSESEIVWFDTLLCLFMMAEWFTLLWLADRRAEFARARWLDLFASLPLLLLFRPFRVVRLVRLLRLPRGAVMFNKLLRPWREALGSTLLRSAAFTTVALILLAALVVSDIERENESLDTYPKAVWWAIVTTSTVGYGHAIPVTVGGRFVGVVLMVMGIGYFGSFAASVTIACSRHETAKANEEILERLEAMEKRLLGVLDKT